MSPLAPPPDIAAGRRLPGWLPADAVRYRRPSPTFRFFVAAAARPPASLHHYLFALMLPRYSSARYDIFRATPSVHDMFEFDVFQMPG